jgi:hypothetical protein
LLVALLTEFLASFIRLHFGITHTTYFSILASQISIYLNYIQEGEHY